MAKFADAELDFKDYIIYSFTQIYITEESPATSEFKLKLLE
jgi:hypothetical protein